MKITQELANAFRAAYLGPNFPGVSFNKVLENITWQQANQKVSNYNTIATLVFHTNYYVAGVLEVLKGGDLNIKDKFSFDATPINCVEDWELLKAKSFKDAEDFACAVEKMDDSKLSQPFTIEKYGTWFRNLNGVLEHCYYHLGQISLIKKQLH